MKTNEIEEQLKIMLKPSRYRHTLGVADTAATLAMAYGGDIHQAYLAGLLHDCAKGYFLEEQRELCKKYGISLDGALTDSPQLMHAKLAPYVAKNLFGIDDPDIQNALSYHTTGRPEMTPLEQYIFVADYMEPSRPNISGLDEVRKVAYHNLHRCIGMILSHTITYLKEQGRPIGEDTMKAFTYYQEKE